MTVSSKYWYTFNAGKEYSKSEAAEWVGQYIFLVTEPVFITVMKRNFPRWVCVAVQLSAVHCAITEEEGNFRFMTIFEMY
jgi:hypothetical protein